MIWLNTFNAAFAAGDTKTSVDARETYSSLLTKARQAGIGEIDGEAVEAAVEKISNEDYNAETETFLFNLGNLVKNVEEAVAGGKSIGNTDPALAGFMDSAKLVKEGEVAHSPFKQKLINYCGNVKRNFCSRITGAIAGSILLAVTFVAFIIEPTIGTMLSRGICQSGQGTWTEAFVYQCFSLLSDGSVSIFKVNCQDGGSCPFGSSPFVSNASTTEIPGECGIHGCVDSTGNLHSLPNDYEADRIIMGIPAMELGAGLFLLAAGALGVSTRWPSSLNERTWRNAQELLADKERTLEKLLSAHRNIPHLKEILQYLDQTLTHYVQVVVHN
jgi:hypothetical protein